MWPRLKLNLLILDLTNLKELPMWIDLDSDESADSSTESLNFLIQSSK